ncbi:BHLH domain-containing protein [Pseudomonas sp. IT-P258]|uniref:hypothetical protein n=1 Tax=Pseudomonas sp. IT-P258 TaxID=3026447 RepID=UPI0039DF31A1
MSSVNENLSAEQRFRQAFERLKADSPKILMPGTPVSQNNVAKEAACDPSALRKSRFPSLVREIKVYVDINKRKTISKRRDQLRKRTLRSDLKKRLDVVKAQRDFAQSQLISAQQRVMELASELFEIKEYLATLKPVPLIK